VLFFSSLAYCDNKRREREREREREKSIGIQKSSKVSIVPVEGKKK
jgi:hypothetical protein